MEKKPYYITTAIAYASAKPHIGNTYEIVLADAIARFRREQGYDVRFQTGTDEHGEKIEQKAVAAGMSPKEYVDQVAGVIKNIWDLMDTTYDRFIRTTDEDHEEQVRKMFRKMYEKGDIYKGYYEGWYCTPGTFRPLPGSLSRMTRRECSTSLRNNLYRCRLFRTSCGTSSAPALRGPHPWS